jgi:hypothetical protein
MTQRRFDHLMTTLDKGGVMKKRFFSRIGTPFFPLLFVLLGLFDIAVAEQPPIREVKLIADDAVLEAKFGRSIAMGGNLVAVGAGRAKVGNIDSAGAVYLFKRQGPNTSLIGTREWLI